MTAAMARRRASALSSEGSPVPTAMTAHAWLVAQLTTFALPIDATRLVPSLPAAGLLVLVGVSWIAGPLGILFVAIAVSALTLAVRSGAPRRRALATERALPGVLDAIARQLRAGGSLAQAIGAVRPPPTAHDLGAQWDRLHALVPVVGVTAALDDWASSSTARANDCARPIGLAAAALALASTTGGSPARAVDGVAATLRSRLAVSEEIRALSSQARASAVVIALAPLVFGALGGATDARSGAFLTSPAGATLVALGVGLDGIGAWWMARLCRPGAA